MSPLTQALLALRPGVNFADVDGSATFYAGWANQQLSLRVYL